MKTRSFLLLMAGMSLSCGDDDVAPPSFEDQPWYGPDGCQTNIDEWRVHACYGEPDRGGTVVQGSADATDPYAEITVTTAMGEVVLTIASEFGSFAAAVNAELGTVVSVEAEASGCRPVKIYVEVVECH
jgi:hypothetical protein